MALTDMREGSGEAGVDIAAWLQRLGLEQYEQAFQGNDIDDEVRAFLCAGRDYGRSSDLVPPFCCAQQKRF
jgi:hypothetical protein